MSHSDLYLGEVHPTARPAHITALGTSWPEPFATWAAPEYPVGRGQEAPLRGWVCSGCGHGFGPAVRECSYCPETVLVNKAAGPAVPDDEDYER